MKSFIHTINKLAVTPVGGVIRGLGKVRRVYGFRATMNGLEPYENLNDPGFLSSIGDHTFPDPFVFSGRLYSIIVNGNKVYGINSESSVLSYTLLTEEYSGLENTLEPHKIWSFADGGDYFVLTNGSRVYYGQHSIMAYKKAYQNISAVCTYKGRMVFGGFDSNSTWSQEWKDFFQDIDDIQIPGFRKNTIVFTPVGTDYFWMFNTPVDRVKTLWQNNEIIVMNIPIDEQILAMGELGDNLMVYTSSRVYQVKFVTSPIFTPSIVGYLPFGLSDYGSVNTRRDKHFGVGSDYRVFEITQEGIKEYEYQDLMKWLGSTVRILYDAIKKDYYITDGDFTFLLTPFGLTEIEDKLSEVFVIDRNIYKI